MIWVYFCLIFKHLGAYFWNLSRILGVAIMKIWSMILTFAPAVKSDLIAQLTAWESLFPYEWWCRPDFN